VHYQNRISLMSDVPFGARVRTLRLAHVLTQRELAERADVVPVNRVENAPPGADLALTSTIRKLARALKGRPQSLVAPEAAD
jgi:transcriptional regulator with XRE-family HTH domain